mgnify:CR=1 FL=1
MIFQNIKAMLEEVLGVDAQEITLAANLVDDLAAESIDFVDIIYALEQQYKLTIAPGDIFPAFLQQGQFMDQQGEVCDTTKTRLTTQYPHLSQACLNEFFEEKQASVFFRVSVLVDFISYQLSLTDAASVVAASAQPA